MVKNSILMTTFDREPEIMLATLRSLRRSGVSSDDELVIVDDGSTEGINDYLKAYLEQNFSNQVYLSLPGDYPAFRTKGFNCPSKAFNVGLEVCRGERLIVMSSDVWVTPNALKAARAVDVDEMAWSPMVIDLDSRMEYVGPRRLFPMPWFLVTSTEAVRSIGGWDEQYLAGLCYEDNDFVGRLVLKLGTFACDWNFVVYHQSHYQQAYDVDDDEIKAANDRNRQYTLDKWGGIPFDHEFTPFDVVRTPHVSGLATHKVIGRGDLAERLGVA
jgi:glycosyltransferase involved in cell wall biosynthesis